MSLINDTKERIPVSFADNKSHMNICGYIINDIQFHFELPFKLVSNYIWPKLKQSIGFESVFLYGGNNIGILIWY
jgi:hypothetical protein